MSESYFTKLANDILDASEKIVDRFEEGLNILLGELSDNSGSGAAANNNKASSSPSPESATEDEFEGWDGNEEANMEDPSPLAGIAQSVMEDIMAGQVSTRIALAAKGSTFISKKTCTPNIHLTLSFLTKENT
jgi:hypothetical protein